MIINHLNPKQASTTTIDLGRQDYMSTILRLTRMELYKLRRRRYNKVVFAVLLSVVVLVTLIIGFFVFSQAHSSAASFAPPRCAKNDQYCTTQTFSQAQLEQIKTLQIQTNARFLSLPGSLIVITIALSSIALLSIILLGTIAGTEYGMGTIRLLFTRGPTRLQCMLAKVVASLTYIAFVLLLMLLVYVILNIIIYPLAGEPYSYAFSFFSQANFSLLLWHALLLWIIAVGYWFAYAMLTVFFGTLGRSTAASIGGAFIWYMLESILTLVLGYVQGSIPAGWLHNFVRAIPDYLLTNNFTVLIQNQMHNLLGTSLARISSTQAALVAAVYLVVLIGASCVLTIRRDVTN